MPGLRKEQIQPVGIRFTSDGKLGFVALGPANRVAVIDGGTKAVIKYLLVGQRVWHLALTPDDKLLFATNGVSNDVSVDRRRSAEGLEIDRRRLLPLGRGDHQPMNGAHDALEGRDRSRRRLRSSMFRTPTAPAWRSTM